MSVGTSIGYWQGWRREMGEGITGGISHGVSGFRRRTKISGDGDFPDDWS
jgi:hypothetical protein